MDHPEFELATIVSIDFQENSYIARLRGRQDCLVVDPGLEPEKILQYLNRNQLSPAAVLNTHGHADHIAGNAHLKRRWPDCPIVIGAGDAGKLVSPQENLSAFLGSPIVSPAADVTVDEGDSYSAAGFDLDVLAIPGHSAGHVVFLWRAVQPYLAFVGDVIFSGSIGRTDFPDGNYRLLIDGIHTKLFALPDDTILYSGHGPATTVGEEKANNPFAGIHAS